MNDTKRCILNHLNLLVGSLAVSRNAIQMHWEECSTEDENLADTVSLLHDERVNLPCVIKAIEQVPDSAFEGIVLEKRIKT